MTPIERQILKNQLQIMIEIRNKSNLTHGIELTWDIENTKDLLSQEKSEEPCCEMPEEENCFNCGYCDDCINEKDFAFESNDSVKQEDGE